MPGCNFIERVSGVSSNSLPGESRPLNKALAPDTRFLGIVAVYRDLERATWRTTVAIKPGTQHKLDIRAERLAVTVKPRP